MTTEMNDTQLWLSRLPADQRPPAEVACARCLSSMWHVPAGGRAMAFCRVMHVITFTGKPGADVVVSCREADLSLEDE